MSSIVFPRNMSIEIPAWGCDRIEQFFNVSWSNRTPVHFKYLGYRYEGNTCWNLFLTGPPSSPTAAPPGFQPVKPLRSPSLSPLSIHIFRHSSDPVLLLKLLSEGYKLYESCSKSHSLIVYLKVESIGSTAAKWSPSGPPKSAGICLCMCTRPVRGSGPISPPMAWSTALFRKNTPKQF